MTFLNAPYASPPTTPFFTAPLPGPTEPVFLPEGSTFSLPYHGELEAVLVNGQALPRANALARFPVIQDTSGGRVRIKMNDWVGRQHIQILSTRGEQQATLWTYPHKLSPQPLEAFRALAVIADELPQLTTGLRFPTALLPNMTGIQTQNQIQASDLRRVAGELWQLERRAKQAPSSGPASQVRKVAGGIVPDRVDWGLTFDHWGRGGFPEHLARVLPPERPELSEFPELWQRLGELALSLPESAECRELTRQLRQQAGRQTGSQVGPQGRQQVRQQAGQQRHRIQPTNRTRHTAPTRRIQHLIEQLGQQLEGLGRRADGLPQGSVSMAALYEVWAQARLLRMVGATEGEFVPTGNDLYTGTFRGPGVTAYLNLRVNFQGLGGYQQQMPDLVLEFASGRCVVGEIKYRALTDLPPEEQRNITVQLLTYMGLFHADTGLAVWPGTLTQAPTPSPLGLGRAQLLRLPLHPLGPLPLTDPEIRPLF